MPEWINYKDRRVAESPKRIIWWVCGTILSITMVLVIAIGGAYLVAVHAISAQQQTARQEGVAICKALVTLDQSGDRVVFDKPGPSEIVLGRMLKGIHGVVVTSGCEKR
jgi:uncharacterized protein YpmB